MRVKHKYTSDQKLKWFGYGEWVEEPDEAHFSHNGIECRIKRIVIRERSDEVFGGYFCGFVCVPSGHAWENKDESYFYEKIDINVYGGITCFLYKKMRFWIGFDCAHVNDIIPSFSKSDYALLKEFEESGVYIPDQNFKYKNIKFAESECRTLADQVKIAVKNESAI